MSEKNVIWEGCEYELETFLGDALAFLEWYKERMKKLEPYARDTINAIDEVLNYLPIDEDGIPEEYLNE